MPDETIKEVSRIDGKPLTRDTSKMTVFRDKQGFFTVSQQTWDDDYLAKIELCLRNNLYLLVPRIVDQMMRTMHEVERYLDGEEICDCVNAVIENELDKMLCT